MRDKFVKGWLLGFAVSMVVGMSLGLRFLEAMFFYVGISFLMIGTISASSITVNKLPKEGRLADKVMMSTAASGFLIIGFYWMAGPFRGEPETVEDLTIATLSTMYIVPLQMICVTTIILLLNYAWRALKKTQTAKG